MHKVAGWQRRTLMMPAIRFNSSSMSEGDTFSRVVATRMTEAS